MDKVAVNAAEDTLLQEFGLVARGDIVALRAYCYDVKAVNVSTDILKDAITNNKRLFSSATSPKLKYRSVLFGWLHYVPRQKKYINVRSKKGGGCRNVSMQLSATKDDLLKAAKNVFFDGNNTQFGSVNSLNVELGTFCENIIGERLELDGKIINFTLRDYVKKFKLCKIRLYILTKRKTFIQQVALDEVYSQNESSSTDTNPSIKQVNQAIDLPTFMEESSSQLIGYSDEKLNLNSEIQSAYIESLLSDHKEEERDKKVEQEEKEPRKEIAPTFMEESLSQLIGSSDERMNLNSEIQSAYTESLLSDQKKERDKKVEQEEKELRKEIADENKRKAEELKAARTERVPVMPDLREDHVVVSVRHCSEGVIRRLFASKFIYELCL